MSAENYPDTMSTADAPAAAAQHTPNRWQRSLWPLVLFVAVPLFLIGLVEEHWLSLEGCPALLFGLSGGAAAGVTVVLISDKARKLWRQRRAAEAASPGSRNSR